MPFKSKGRKILKARVYDEHGVGHVRTLETDDADEANEIRDFLTRLRRQGRWPVLKLIINRTMKARTLYLADHDGVLQATIALRLEKTAAAERLAGEPDLDELLNEWKRSGANAKYIAQCRKLIPSGTRYPISKFTRGPVSKFLDGLKVKGATKNRYRAALSRFCAFLVKREYLQSNFVRDIEGFGESRPRMVHYDEATSRAVIDGLENPFKALEALMCGTGIEWSAAVRVRPSDVSIESREVKARGTKTEWRNREVRFLDEYCWRVFLIYRNTVVGNSPMFGKLNPTEAMKAHRAALKAVSAEDSTLHDWRHTFAVREIAKGTPYRIIKHQLGHSPNSTLVERIYGASKPTSADYAALAVTRNATPRRKQAR